MENLYLKAKQNQDETRNFHSFEAKEHQGNKYKNETPTIEDISNIHEYDIMNNKDQLLTEGLNNLSFSKDNKRTCDEYEFKKKYIDTSANHFEHVRVNKTFYLIKHKRIEQMLNSSIEVSMDDIGGERACCRLKKLYEINMNKSGSGFINGHERSSSMPMINRNQSIIEEENEQKKNGGKSKYAHISSRYKIGMIIIFIFF